MSQTSADRSDGLATKARLIETAGRLIAQRGYAETTAKDICAAARTNTAAVNYHFGGRDGLYLAVLKEVHNTLLSVDGLREIAARPVSPREKIDAFLDYYIHESWNKKGWHIRVWIRELVQPSPLFATILHDNAFPKLRIVLSIFREYMGLKEDDPRLLSAVLAFIAPFGLVFLAGHASKPRFTMESLSIARAELLTHLRTFALAGLDAMCATRA